MRSALSLYRRQGGKSAFWLSLQIPNFTPRNLSPPPLHFLSLSLLLPQSEPRLVPPDFSPRAILPVRLSVLPRSPRSLPFQPECSGLPCTSVLVLSRLFLSNLPTLNSWLRLFLWHLFYSSVFLSTCCTFPFLLSLDKTVSLFPVVSIQFWHSCVRTIDSPPHLPLRNQIHNIPPNPNRNPRAKDRKSVV